MVYTPKIDRHEEDGSRTAMTLVEADKLDAYQAIGAAAQDLLPYVGEINGGEFYPCPQPSLSGDVRDEIAPWIHARWAALLVAVETVYGPQACGHEPPGIDGETEERG